MDKMRKGAKAPTYAISLNHFTRKELKMSEILEVLEVLLLAYIAINIHKINSEDRK